TRTFAIRTSDGMIGLLGAPLLDALRAEAPRVTVRFLPEGDEDVAALREGRIDLDVGIIGDMGPEIRVQALARDRFVGVVRRGSPLASGKVTLQRFVEHPHLGVSRLGKTWGPIDDALKKKGLARTTAAVASGHYAALLLLASSDLVGAFPSKWLAHAAPRFDLVTFPLPVTTPAITIAQAWHPRFDADPAHRWLRDRLRRVCRSIAELAA
ncbi:LysR family transcriptional regulator, partial [Sorangium cellulosum]